MTAPAAAPTSGPVAPAPPRAASQPPADRFAFGAVLDSLPGAPAKAGASAGEEQARPSNELPQDESSRGQTAHHSRRNDSALLASLPFALRAGAMMDDRPQAADDSPSLTAPAMKASKSEDSSASLSAAAKATTVGRLIGERAFHLGASTFAGVIASRARATDGPFAQGAASPANLTPQADLKGESLLAAGFARDEVLPAQPLADAIPPLANATAPAPIGPRAGAPPANRASLTRAAAQEARPSGQKPEGSAPPPVVRAASPASRRRASRIEREDGRRSPARSDHVWSDANSADNSVWRTALGAFRRGPVVRG